MIKAFWNPETDIKTNVEYRETFRNLPTIEQLDFMKDLIESLTHDYNQLLEKFNYTISYRENVH